MPVAQAKRTGGFTLLEMAMASSILAIVLMGMVSVVTSSYVLQDVTQETELATQAARRVIEQMEAAEFSQVFVLYNSNPADDPNGANTAPGNYFSVPLLTPLQGSVYAGEIKFPSAIGAGGKMEIHEDYVSKAWNMPRDLNNDGKVDALDHSADYKLLPVTVRVAWRGRAMPLSVEVNTLLIKRN